MSLVSSNRQRAHLYTQQGQPVLALEFDVFEGNKVSMWTHTRHEVPFADMQAAFEAISEHLRSFIADGAMCPFHPEFISVEP